MYDYHVALPALCDGRTDITIITILSERFMVDIRT